MTDLLSGIRRNPRSMGHVFSLEFKIIRSSIILITFNIIELLKNLSLDLFYLGTILNNHVLKSNLLRDVKIGPVIHFSERRPI